MESNGGKIPAPFQPLHHRRHCHHHHVFSISPHCPLHRSILHPTNHSPSCAISSHQYSESFEFVPRNSHSNLLDNQLDSTFHDSLLMQNEFENLETDEEDDPVFVLTDEWRDFFAKSEARRKQEKKKTRKERNRKVAA